MFGLSQCATADPDGRKRALLIGGGIANFTDVAATFNGIIRALREKVVFLTTFSKRTNSCYSIFNFGEDKRNAQELNRCW